MIVMAKTKYHLRKDEDNMKTSIYLENAEVKALLKAECKTSDLGVAFDKVDAAKGLKHDDLARAMYIAAEAGTTKDNVASLLSLGYKQMLESAVDAGQIDAKYLARWK
nr:MAG TPA: hypothetical protein [Caudoviricetes sp.]